MALLVEMDCLLLFDFKELLEEDYDANTKFLKWRMIRINKDTMAKKQITTKIIEETLWESANKLRGSVELSWNKHVVLSLTSLSKLLQQEEEKKLQLKEPFNSLNYALE